MRADRLLSLMLLLQQKGKQTAAELADALDVSQRTIYRDIDALSGMGVPVYADGGPGGGYRLLDAYRTSLTGLTENEIRALFSFAIPNQISALGGSTDLQRAFLKLSAGLPQQYEDQMRRTEQRLYLDSRGWFQAEPALPHLPTLQQAVWADRKLILGYARQNGTTNRRIVAPYALAMKSELWYLVADTEDGMRVFRVSRIYQAELLAEGFERPTEFDLSAFWGEWSANYEASLPAYPVTLRVTPAARERLEQKFGADLWTTIQEDGDAKKLTVTFEREVEAQAFLLGMGNSVTIVAPKRLRQLVKETAQKIIDHY
ncbi:MAG: YafY family protein [Chloroflexota bacterium]